YQNLGGSFRGRVSATLAYLDDSGLKTARRLGAAGELGVALVGSEWSAEAWAGGGSRMYPDLTVQEHMNRRSTYDELSWSAGTTLRFSSGGRFGLRADGSHQATDSPDPLFDSRSWVASVNLDVRPASRLSLTAHGTYQWRSFDSRPEGGDTDEYWQAGLGLRHSLGHGWALSARCAYSEYGWPDGIRESSFRLLAGVERAWGRPSVTPLPSVDIDALTRASRGWIQKPDASGRVCFRVTAAGAARVSVVGDFNAWDPEATPLKPGADGRWEGCAVIEAGTHQYAYVVDGEWTTPPEAELVVEDGFGGRNGILEVLPAET
ncbi:MAG: isoamylase early set domain-containing protein, partial [Candidatus Eisenbacteria bacterium]|nr:isoamylase early set domain-containing protein [Candidatus Eisenbacteria bacterium]